MPTMRRRLGALAALALLTTSVTLMGQAMTTAASADELIQDGSFEAGAAAGDSPAWTEADTVFGSPICTVGPPLDCATGGGTAAPRTGDAWAWFGGVSSADHTSSMSQQVTIPLGDTTLSYYYYNGNAATPADAVLRVSVDGNVVKTHNEAAADEPGYALVTVNLKAYSDGQAHTLAFDYTSGPTVGDVATNMNVDDVSLQSLYDCAALTSAVDTAKAKATKAAKKAKKASKALKKAKRADPPNAAKIKKLTKKLKAKKKAKKKATKALKAAQANAAPCAPPAARPATSPAARVTPPATGRSAPTGSGGRLS